MSNEIGDDFRAAFLDTLADAGTDCQGGETRKALMKEDRKTGLTTFKFSDEFPIKTGDQVKNLVTGTAYSVVQVRPISVAGSYHCFEVSTKQTAAYHALQRTGARWCRLRAGLSFLSSRAKSRDLLLFALASSGCPASQTINKRSLDSARDDKGLPPPFAAAACLRRSVKLQRNAPAPPRAVVPS